MMRTLTIVTVLSAVIGFFDAWAGHAWAGGVCRDPCGIREGDLCLSVRPPAAYDWGALVLAQGTPAVIHVERQVDRCGEMAALTTAEFSLRVARTPQGPFAETAVASEGGLITWTPTEAGVLYLVASPRDGKGKPGRLVVVVTNPSTPAHQERSVHLAVQPPRGVPRSGAEIMLRYVPPHAGATELGFVAQRWPVPFRGKLPRNGQLLRLPQGTYDLSWRHDSKSTLRLATTTLVVAADAQPASAPPALTFDIPSSNIRVRPRRLTGADWREIVIAPPDRDRVWLAHCFLEGDRRPVYLHVPPGPMALRWYAPDGRVDARPCSGPPGSTTPAVDQTVTVPPGRSVELRWPP
jgi:hypothetical protein